jgi:hypothetical protein
MLSDCEQLPIVYAAKRGLDVAPFQALRAVEWSLTRLAKRTHLGFLSPAAQQLLASSYLRKTLNIICQPNSSSTFTFGNLDAPKVLPRFSRKFLQPVQVRKKTTWFCHIPAVIYSAFVAYPI